MNALDRRGDLTIGIRVAEPELAAQLTVLLAHTPGLRIVQGDEACDVVLSEPEVSNGGFEQPLTPRERDVIALLAEGLSNKEIASRLGISPDTAKFHVGRLIDKLDATGRTDAVAHAARRGVIHL
jgi:DNA-binding CsgD family transcriptional regulator